MRKSALFLSLLFLFAGCIRLTGTAGVWKENAEDGTVKSKQVGFDTQDIVQRDRKQGSITMGEDA